MISEFDEGSIEIFFDGDDLNDTYGDFLDLDTRNDYGCFDDDNSDEDEKESFDDGADGDNGVNEYSNCFVCRISFKTSMLRACTTHVEVSCIKSFKIIVRPY